jgi:hypothetical protein
LSGNLRSYADGTIDFAKTTIAESSTAHSVTNRDSSDPATDRSNSGSKLGDLVTLDKARTACQLVID